MKLVWRERDRKRDWARKNPEKIREAAARWRAANSGLARRQAAERMRRYRAKRKASRS
jgi:hypothetical protein